MKTITLEVLRGYFKAIDAGDVPDPALALYGYLRMDGYVTNCIDTGMNASPYFKQQQWCDHSVSRREGRIVCASCGSDV